MDKRRFLIVVEIATAVASAMFAALVTFDVVTPITLLVFMFVIGAASAMTAPPWQSIVPSLVPREDLPAAVDANSVGINISRAIGPALSGILTGAVGLAAPFWFDVCSNFATIGALIWWRPAKHATQRSPAERCQRHSCRRPLRTQQPTPARATLVRAVAFFLFASAYWALLPLLARSQIVGGPEIYGVLLGAIGAGAVGGAFALTRLKAKFGADGIAVAGTMGTAIALVLYALAHTLLVAFVASLIAGACWIAAISTFNVSAQLALPDWVRGRGLAIYVTVLFGALSIGSAVWGEVAAHFGLPLAHLLAAFGALAGIPLTRGAHLQAAAGLDLSPIVALADTNRRLGPGAGCRTRAGMIEYDLEPAERDRFIDAMNEVARERRRDGAYAWGLYVDTARPGRIVETFLVESWMEHLRQHERVTKADELLQARAYRYVRTSPVVTHLISADALEDVSNLHDPSARTKADPDARIAGSAHESAIASTATDGRHWTPPSH